MPPRKSRVAERNEVGMVSGAVFLGVQTTAAVSVTSTWSPSCTTHADRDNGNDWDTRAPIHSSETASPRSRLTMLVPAGRWATTQAARSGTEPGADSQRFRVT